MSAPTDRRCTLCGSSAHTAPNCPMRGAARQQAQNSKVRHADGATVYGMRRGDLVAVVEASSMEMRLHRSSVAWRILNARRWLQKTRAARIAAAQTRQDAAEGKVND